jgi:hypothetical protein
LVEADAVNQISHLRRLLVEQARGFEDGVGEPVTA